LSDARLRRRQTKLIYPNHRLPPWLAEDATRDRSNRLLDITMMLICAKVFPDNFVQALARLIIHSPSKKIRIYRLPISLRTDAGDNRA
jgi:hypothetical protein